MANFASEEKIAQRRADILQAAIQVFAAKGYHNAAIADIASLLGIGHGTIYRYYKNKRDIFNAILAELLSQMADVVQQEPPTTNTLDEYRAQLERIAAHMMRIFHADPRLARIAFYEALSVEGDARDSVQHFIAVFAQFTEHYMKNGIQKGFLRPSMDTRVAANLITAMMMEAVKQVAEGNASDADIQRWKDEIIHFVIGGLGLR
ncbi:TetR/AcrR family transcriptional regulator [Thalassolituus sp. LLYu03]|uniref:TetR/AcrR family transcriptional regulator n=1 Tax=Thalassolituus sp. LLYu03 TaxID=3421656 RepID=UPI003D26E9C6